jgi:hypothetical protein
MKSTWMFETFRPSPGSPSTLSDSPTVGDVTGRVLVEERAVEERVRATHARLARHEGHLAEPVGVLDRLELAADDVGPRLGVDVDDLSALERQLEPAHDLPAQHERHRRTHRPVGAPAVGRGEDLLRRHVRDEGDPVGRL